MAYGENLIMTIKLWRWQAFAALCISNESLYRRQPAAAAMTSNKAGGVNNHSSGIGSAA